MKKITFYIILLVSITACCKDGYYDENTIKKETQKMVIQRKDMNNFYQNLNIISIEWITTNYIQTVYNDTAIQPTYTDFNLKDTITQFKINHQMGSDTLTINHTWNEIQYKKGCGINKNRFERNLKQATYKLKNGNILYTNNLIILQKN